MKKMLPLFALFCFVLSAYGAPLYPVQYDSNGTIQGWETLRTKNEIAVYGDLSATNEAIRVDMEIADTKISNALVGTNDLIRVDMNAADENLAAVLIETNNLIRSDMGDALNSLNLARDEALIGVSNSLHAAIDLKQDAAPIKSAAFAEASEFATAAEGDLALTAVQPHTDGELFITATGNITLLGQNEMILVPATGMSVYAGAGDDPTVRIAPDGVVIGPPLITGLIESPSTITVSAEDSIDLNSGALDASIWGNIKLEASDLSGPSSKLKVEPNNVMLESLNSYKEARVIATNGTVILEWKGGLADSLHRHQFGALTNYFSTPVTVGNAVNEVQALNRSVADTLYADIAIEDLAANSIQPDTIGNLELTATGLAFIHGGTNNIGGVSLQEGQAILFTEFENPDPEFPFDQYSGVYVDSAGNIRMYWPYELVPGSWGIKEHVFGALTNYFSTPLGVGNATNAAQALNRTVADTLYADISITGTVATAAQGVLAESAVQPDDLVSARSTTINLLNNMEAEVITILQGGYAGDVMYRTAYDGVHYTYGNKVEGEPVLYYSGDYWHFAPHWGSSGGATYRCFVNHNLVPQPRTPPATGWETLLFGSPPIVAPISGAFLEGSYRWSSDIAALEDEYADISTAIGLKQDAATAATDAELSATSNTLAAATSAVAESVVNLSHVVNPSLWGLSINGDLEPAGVSLGLLDDGLFEIDLTTGDIVLTGTQSTRFWQVSGSDIYPEVN